MATDLNRACFDAAGLPPDGAAPPAFDASGVARSGVRDDWPVAPRPTGGPRVEDGRITPGVSGLGWAMTDDGAARNPTATTDTVTTDTVTTDTATIDTTAIDTADIAMMAPIAPALHRANTPARPTLCIDAPDMLSGYPE